MSSKSPPIGYDDPSVIPGRRLYVFAEKISKILETISKVGELPFPEELKKELDALFLCLKEESEQLDLTHFQVIEQLLLRYEQFSKDPEQNLAELQENVENLKLLISED